MIYFLLETFVPVSAHGFLLTVKHMLIFVAIPIFKKKNTKILKVSSDDSFAQILVVATNELLPIVIDIGISQHTRRDVACR